MFTQDRVTQAPNSSRFTADNIFFLDTPVMFPASDEQYDYLLKVVLIGDSGVGKSNLLSRYTRNVFENQSKATIGVEFATKTLRIDGKNVRTEIWDTAGQERFRSITAAYYRRALGCIIVFDLSHRQSFLNLESWMKEVRTLADPGIRLVMVGNKSDLMDQRAVTFDEASTYADQYEADYLETSALNSANVRLLFEQLIEQIYRREATQLNISQESADKLTIRAEMSEPATPAKKCCGSK